MTDGSASAWDILARLWRLQRAVFRDAAPCLERHGLQPVAVLVLSRLGEGVTPSQLARALGVAAPTVSHILRRLEREGLVRREVDPRDLRRFRFSPTETGLFALAAAQECAGRALQARLERLDEEERRQLARLLDAMLDDLREATGE